MKAKSLPTLQTVTTFAKSKVFHIQTVDLVFSNGEKRQFERLLSQNKAVMVAPMLDDDTVLLIREYAVGLEQYELGLPKGVIDAGEDNLTAANRELQEEAGFAARQFQSLKTLATAPGYLSHTIDLIVAEDLYASRLDGDEPEPLEVVPWKLSELDTLLTRNDCNSARTIAALYLVRDFLQQRML